MTRIAFDVHGTLDHDVGGLLMGILNGCLKDKDEVFIISGPPTDQIVREITALGIDPANVTIISVVDWLKKNGVHMWQDDKGDWWCDENDWWSSKGKICAEYGITMIFDDKLRYKKHMPETVQFVLWEGTKDVTYYGRGGKSKEIDSLPETVNKLCTKCKREFPTYEGDTRNVCENCRFPIT